MAATGIASRRRFAPALAMAAIAGAVGASGCSERTGDGPGRGARARVERTAYPDRGRDSNQDHHWPAAGDKVVTRSYGVATVKSADASSVVVGTAAGTELRIPRAEVGATLRPLMKEKVARRVLAALRSEDAAADPRPWSARQPEHARVLREGGPEERARLLRILYAGEKPLGFGEQKMTSVLEAQLFEELELVLGGELSAVALRAEMYRRYPGAAPPSRRDPMMGDCFMRMCFRLVEASGPLPARDAWLGFMRNGSRAASCVPADAERNIELRARVAADGSIEVRSVEGGEGGENACIQKGFSQAVLLGMPPDATEPTRVRLGFTLKRR